MISNRATFPNRTVERTTVPRDCLVSASQKHLPVTFPELHAMYSRRLYKTIFAITRNREDTEDALQETFLRAYLKLDTFEDRSSIYSWLTRIAINSALMILRRRRCRAEISFDHPSDSNTQNISFECKDPALDPEEHAELQQRQAIVLRAIYSLDSRLREPIRMQMLYGWSNREIGRTLNLSVAAVKTRLHRARVRLSATQAGTNRSGTRWLDRSLLSRQDDPSTPGFNQRQMRRGFRETRAIWNATQI